MRWRWPWRWGKSSPLTQRDPAALSAARRRLAEARAQTANVDAVLRRATKAIDSMASDEQLAMQLRRLR